MELGKGRMKGAMMPPLARCVAKKDCALRRLPMLPAIGIAGGLNLSV